MTAYVGGDSVLGNHAPKLRYAVDLPKGVDLNYVTFNICTVKNGVVTKTHLNSEMINNEDDSLNTYCLFPELASGWNNHDNSAVSRGGSYLEFTDDDNDPLTFAGTYSIYKVDSTDEWDSWYITATDKNGTVYLVDLNTAGATLTVRAVYDQDAMYDSSDVNENEYLAPLDTDLKFDEKNNFAAVVTEDAKFTTIGTEDLGILDFTSKDNEVTVETTNSIENIDLLVDDTVSLNINVSAAELEEEMLAAADVSDECGSQFKYFDLVNTKDGNAVVKTENSIKIYWPVPDGVDAETNEFVVEHFEGMDREKIATYDEESKTITIGGTKVNVTEPESKVEKVNGKYYVTFETNTFSPFVLLWEPKAQAENGDENTDDNNQGGTSNNGDGENGGGTEPGGTDNTDNTPGTDDNFAGKPDDADNPSGLVQDAFTNDDNTGTNDNNPGADATDENGNKGGLDNTGVVAGPVDDDGHGLVQDAQTARLMAPLLQIMAKVSQSQTTLTRTKALIRKTSLRRY
jgi:hypothetical protein